MEPTPKLETGWANFDSSFGEPMVTNGDQTFDHKLFPDVIEQCILDIAEPVESLDSTSPIDNLTCKN